MTRPIVVLVATQHAILFRNANHPFNRRQSAHLFHGDGGGVTNQVNLGERLFRALFAVHPYLNVRQLRQMRHQLPVSLAFRLNVR